MPILSVFRAETTDFLERVAEVQWGLMISVFCLSHVPALLTLEIPGYEDQQMLLIAYLVIVTQSSDVLQYIWGKLFGRHKIAPRLSPSKTVEGFVGGTLSAGAIGALLWWITPFTVWESMMSGVDCCGDGFSSVALSCRRSNATVASRTGVGRSRATADSRSTGLGDIRSADIFPHRSLLVVA